MEKISSILRTKQPEEHKKLNNKRHKHRKHRKKNYLSFEFIDRLMREPRGVDESRCRGR